MKQIASVSSISSDLLSCVAGDRSDSSVEGSGLESRRDGRQIRIGGIDGDWRGSALQIGTASAFMDGQRCSVLGPKGASLQIATANWSDKGQIPSPHLLDELMIGK